MNQNQRFFSLAVFFAFLNSSYLFAVQAKRLSSSRPSVKVSVENSPKNYATMPVGELYQLALSYRKGDKGIQDNKCAFELFEIGAHRHHAPAEFQLGSCYDFGRGVTPDPIKAFKYYQRAAKQDYTPAQTSLGVCYASGAGVSVDRPKALKLYHIAAKKKTGNCVALFNLGACYEEGNGVKVDLKKAFEYYQRAAEQEDADAEYEVGLCYEQGKGVKVDRAEARKYFKRAASHGNEEAEKKLAAVAMSLDCTKSKLASAPIQKSQSSSPTQPVATTSNVARVESTAASCARERIIPDSMHCHNYSSSSHPVCPCGATMSRDANGSEVWNEAVKSQSSRLSAEDLYQLALQHRTGQGAIKDDAMAFTLFEDAAELGHAAALHEVGRCFYLGLGVGVDKTEALKWFRLAAQKGYKEPQEKGAKKPSKALVGPECQQVASSSSSVASGSLTQGQRNAQPNEATMSASELFDLGEKYRLGNGVAKDEKRAIEYYDKAAKLKHSAALHQMGRCYYFGELGVAIDYVKAFEYYQRAAQQKFAKSQNNLGLCYQNGKGIAVNPIKAFEYYQAAADQGCSQAQCNLGFCYEKGIGVGANPVKAFENYQLAANQCHAQAQCNLGFCYEKGIGVGANPVKALENYQLAANQGYTQAQFNLGVCYQYGNGVAINRAEALKFYELALKGGHAEAQQQLDVLLSNIDVQRDCANLTAERLFELGQRYRTTNGRLAYALFKLATDKGYAPAENSLGFCHEYGQGTFMSMAKAVELYRSAAQKGWSKAQYNLGRCYQYGKGFLVDNKEAVVWYERSARQGFAEAQYRLGLCYENGWGTDVNQEKAAEWYELAARQEHAEARSSLTRIAPMRAIFADELKPLSNGDLTSNSSSSSSSSQASTSEVDSKNDGQRQKETKEAVAECARTSASSTLHSSSSSPSSSSTKSSNQNVMVTDVIDEEDDNEQAVHEQSRTDGTHVSSSSSSSASLGSLSSSAAALGVSVNETVNEQKEPVSDNFQASSSSSSSSALPERDSRPSNPVSQAPVPEVELNDFINFARSRVPVTRPQQVSQCPQPKADSTLLEEGLRKQIVADIPEQISIMIEDWGKIKADWGKECIDAEKKKRDQHFKGVAKQWVLVGPPGTGKTSMSKAIAQTCGMPFFMYRAPEVSNTFQNSGSENLAKIFHDVDALGQPCMIIIDELEVWFKRHANKHDSDYVLTEFWGLLDRYKDHPILVIATANDISEAPPQINSRISSHIIRMPLPTEQQREGVLKYYMGSIFGSVDPVSAKLLAHSTNTHSCRDLETLVRTARERETARQASIQQGIEKRAEAARQALADFPVVRQEAAVQMRQDLVFAQGVPAREQRENAPSWKVPWKTLGKAALGLAASGAVSWVLLRHGHNLQKELTKNSFLVQGWLAGKDTDKFKSSLKKLF